MERTKSKSSVRITISRFYFFSYTPLPHYQYRTYSTEISSDDDDIQSVASPASVDRTAHPA
ncbi:hypothetical protein BC936DRAFT_140048 [Jimgerdemannia flammicorona]|uniref:Uncharacterized protein n=1 Tax=Jimgerdemannia flammicorona TaxID=994334 RepID=A0A433B4R7_9FUNG|nr:hypothetical protein BC936DRAFT_140048 [Jimgerdemannia flammicorona]